MLGPILVDVEGLLIRKSYAVPRLYTAVLWITIHVTEPVLELLYQWKLTNHKPISQYTVEDIL